MHIIVGVDSEGIYRKGLDLALALDYPDLRATLVHAIEPVLPDSGPESLGMANAIGEILRARESQGKQVLSEAAASLACPTQSALEVGGAAGVISSLAQKSSADLVVVGSSNKGTWGSLFFGSVTKGVVIDSEQSVLVGKRPARSSGLTVVIATDHSEYMNACLDRFISTSPRGINRIELVCAVPHSASFMDFLSTESAEAASELPEVMAREAKRKNEEVAGKLRSICRDVQTRVTHGHPNEVIRETMQDVSADLAIIGARGHGFLERAILGSISTHQVVSESYNVLVLRR